MHFFWTVCVLSLFPITVWYFISFKRMSSLLESKYPEKWEVLGKVGFINNNSLSNSNKVIRFLLKEEYRELNDGDLNKTVLVNPNWTLLLENSQTLQVTDRY
ncbi:hypothetical protein DIKCMJMK_04221 [Shewanella oneidensis]|uniref:hypothetical protein n=1 Tax=Shewanella oneidensis TaxID=70863 RepID=UPI002E7C39D6|nr:hypothetical protein [Shewanella oneidensis]MEE2030317.1 hypothetical protein [Shewanella oneidensis]